MSGLRVMPKLLAVPESWRGFIGEGALPTLDGAFSRWVEVGGKCAFSTNNSSGRKERIPENQAVTKSGYIRKEQDP